MEFALDNSLFWFAVVQIIAIDILLGGDNAVVIALACRSLPEEQRKKGIFWGVAGAIILRVALLGCIAGDMMARDPAVSDWVKERVKENLVWLESYHIAGIIGAIGVVAIGMAITLGRSACGTAQST